jgi:hypothetical protein
MQVRSTARHQPDHRRVESYRMLAPNGNRHRLALAHTIWRVIDAPSCWRRDGLRPNRYEASVVGLMHGVGFSRRVPVSYSMVGRGGQAPKVVVQPGKVPMCQCILPGSLCNPKR